MPIPVMEKLSSTYLTNVDPAPRRDAHGWSASRFLTRGVSDVLMRPAEGTRLASADSDNVRVQAGDRLTGAVLC
jgi:hypothetical protein